jgi:(p)ppGpp synthase/HD superfamily hydrolase
MYISGEVVNPALTHEIFHVMSPLEIRARHFAVQHHESAGHLRKPTGESYTHHLAAVVAILRELPNTPEILAAAWLHDTIGNTKVTQQELVTEFGPAVAALVAMLTDVSRPTDGNRETRKKIDRKHTARASPAGKTIKLADLLENAKFIATSNPEFLGLFLEELSALLSVLREGDTTLWTRARNLVPHKVYSRFSAP